MPPRASSMPQPWPAVSPDQTKETERRSAGAVRKRPTFGSPTTVGDGQVLKADAVEDVLAGRQAVDQRLGGEVGLRQRIDEHRADVAEALGGGDLHCMRDGRSARAQTTPESVETSPDCTPCVRRGRSAARLR